MKKNSASRSPTEAWRGLAVAALLAGGTLPVAAQGSIDPSLPPIGEIGQEASTINSGDLVLEREIRLPDEVRLTFAVWNMASRIGGTEPEPVVQPEPKPQRTWRHTFGAERRTAPWRRLVQAGFEADVIALQGASSLKDVRRLFPIQRYNAVISRQLLAPNTDFGSGIAVLRDDAPATTSVVTRRTRDVRAAGYQHILPDRSASQATGEATAAVTALRLRVYRRFVWIVSADGVQCGGAGATACPRQEELFSRVAQWADSALVANTAMLIAGRWPEQLDKLLPGDIRRLALSQPSTSDCRPGLNGVLVLSRGSADWLDVQQGTDQTARQSAGPRSAPNANADSRGDTVADGARCAQNYRILVKP